MPRCRYKRKTQLQSQAIGNLPNSQHVNTDYTVTLYIQMTDIL